MNKIRRQTELLWKYIFYLDGNAVGGRVSERSMHDVAFVIHSEVDVRLVIGMTRKVKQ